MQGSLAALSPARLASAAGSCRADRLALCRLRWRSRARLRFADHRRHRGDRSGDEIAIVFC